MTVHRFTRDASRNCRMRSPSTGSQEITFDSIRYYGCWSYLTRCPVFISITQRNQRPSALLCRPSFPLVLRARVRQCVRLCSNVFSVPFFFFHRRSQKKWGKFRFGSLSDAKLGLHRVILLWPTVPQDPVVCSITCARSGMKKKIQKRNNSRIAPTQRLSHFEPTVCQNGRDHLVRAVAQLDRLTLNPFDREGRARVKGVDRWGNSPSFHFERKKNKQKLLGWKQPSVRSSGRESTRNRTSAVFTSTSLLERNHQHIRNGWFRLFCFVFVVFFSISIADKGTTAEAGTGQVKMMGRLFFCRRFC